MDPFSCEKHSERHFNHPFDRTNFDPHTLDEKDRRVSAIKEPQESELSPSKFFPIVRKGTRNTTMTIQSIRFKMKTETLIVRGI